jgi:transcriptional regulator with XRE-family HTH domain
LVIIYANFSANENFLAAGSRRTGRYMARRQGNPLTFGPKQRAEDLLVSKDWVAVSEAVSQRIDERRILQEQLAELSGVSTATLRLIQRHPGEHRHTPRTLEAVSKALDWPPDYLDAVLNGRPRPETVEQVTGDPALQSRLDELEQLLRKIGVVLEQRLGQVVDVIYNSNSEVDITIEIKHARHHR